jgi:uncharacterized protein (UPF0248 family)
MKPIIDLLNKIRWDKREKPEDYAIFYFDRISKKLVKVPFELIKRIEGSFMVVDRNSEEVEIPLHRIKQVKKKGVVVWKR